MERPRRPQRRPRRPQRPQRPRRRVLQPDRQFVRCSDIDVHADIVAAGFTAVLLDVDNTILPRDGSGIPTDIRAWLVRLQAAGVRICLMSNNWHAPVHECAAALNLPLVCGCVKPLPFAFFAARKRINARRTHTLVIGDQLVTDIWGAHISGMPAYLTRPLCTTDLWHTRALRHVERVILRTEHRKDPEGKD